MAAEKAYLNIRIDKGVKEVAARLLASMGLDHTTAIEMYYRQIIKERRLPFQPEAAIDIDEQLARAIREANIPHKAVEVDERAQIVVDPGKEPELYDWAKNG